MPSNTPLSSSDSFEGELAELEKKFKISAEVLFMLFSF